MAGMDLIVWELAGLALGAILVWLGQGIGAYVYHLYLPPIVTTAQPTSLDLSPEVEAWWNANPLASTFDVHATRAEDL
jgi:hypothetical protein